MTKKTTVIIPCIKQNDLLKQTIDHCKRLTSDVDIIVVSKDPIKTEDLGHPNIKSIVTEFVNMSMKRNLAAKESVTDYIALIDSDAYPEPTWIENAIKELESNPEIGMVGGPELSPHVETPQERWVGLASRSALVTGSHNFRKLRSPRRYYSEMSSCNLVMRREDYLKIGGMNENLFIGEDQELGKRVREQLGKKLLFSPEVVVYHKNRELVPFLIQRYARGMAIAIAIKRLVKDIFEGRIKTLKDFRWELFVAPLFIISVCVLFAGLFFNPWVSIFLGTILAMMYFSVIALQAKKCSEKLSDYPFIFLTIAAGTIISGAGAVFSLLNINPNISALYRNKNDAK